MAEGSRPPHVAMMAAAGGGGFFGSILAIVVAKILMGPCCCAQSVEIEKERAAQIAPAETSVVVAEVPRPKE